MSYTKHLNPRKTPQSQPIPGQEDRQVRNSAGGYTYQIDDMKRMERFLILGAEGGTYYANERKLVIDNAQVIIRLAREGRGPEMVSLIKEISVARRAPKNTPALFALAICTSPQFADRETRSAAYGVVNDVARTASDHMRLQSYQNDLRGWGRSRKEATASWYNDRELADLAYQITKYGSRYGFTHRDLLYLCRGELGGRKTGPRQLLYDLVLSQSEAARKTIMSDDCPAELRIIKGSLLANGAGNVAEVVGLIQEYRLTHEMIPSQWLKEPQVWGALVETMPSHALVRNIGRLSSLGLTKPMTPTAATIISRVANVNTVHPANVLLALDVYDSGQSVKGDLRWEVNPAVSDALETALYQGFGSIPTTNKRIMLAVDVSGSMGRAIIANSKTSARKMAAVLAMVTARSEPNAHIVGFSEAMAPLNITAKSRLSDVLRMTNDLPFGATDCALPMMYAMGNQPEYSIRGWQMRHLGYKKVSQTIMAVDAFIILTDNETWYGSTHPMQALQEYRAKSGIPAKLVVQGMTSTDFSIADPNDAGCLDVVGCDTSTPQVIAQFIGEDDGYQVETDD